MREYDEAQEAYLNRRPGAGGRNEAWARYLAAQERRTKALAAARSGAKAGG